MDSEKGYEKELINIQGEDGEVVQCEVLSTFEAEETGKTYVIYIPDGEDENEEVELYGVELQITEEGPRFLPLIDQRDLDIVNKFIDEMVEE